MNPLRPLRGTSPKGRGYAPPLGELADARNERLTERDNERANKVSK